MGKLIKTDIEYKSWISNLKLRIRQSQIKAAIKVNTELLQMYWELGKDIVEQQSESKWGSGFFTELSQDLKDAFPNMQGFSVSNLKYIKRFYSFYNEAITIRHQLGDELTSQIFSTPWRHQIEIFTKSKSIDEALFYVHQTIEQGWSRSMLMNHIDAKLFETAGKAITNFDRCLPTPQSDLAQELTKDPYNFDFLTLREGYLERDFENALIDNITKFLIELGNGFAYVGRQVRLEVGGDEFFIDLLFYHLKLRCYIVIELKTGNFQPEYIGKLSFYVSAVNHQMKIPQDNPTIGLLICKNKNNIVARYTLDNIDLPIGISEYELNQLCTTAYKTNLPSIEDIENQLKD